MKATQLLQSVGWRGVRGHGLPQYLILGAKARVLLKGRFAVHAQDVRALAQPVLRHRIFTNFNADAEGVGAEQIIDKFLETIAEPAYGEPAPTGTTPGSP